VRVVDYLAIKGAQTALELSGAIAKIDWTPEQRRQVSEAGQDTDFAGQASRALKNLELYLRLIVSAKLDEENAHSVGELSGAKIMLEARSKTKLSMNTVTPQIISDTAQEIARLLLAMTTAAESAKLDQEFLRFAVRIYQKCLVSIAVLSAFSAMPKPVMEPGEQSWRLNALVLAARQDSANQTISQSTAAGVFELAKQIEKKT
jgi:hypothetical protein